MHGVDDSDLPVSDESDAPKIQKASDELEGILLGEEERVNNLAFAAVSTVRLQYVRIIFCWTAHAYFWISSFHDNAQAAAVEGGATSIANTLEQCLILHPILALDEAMNTFESVCLISSHS